jgi:CO/xanthine dehydrogenase FAD-binding subunit
VRIKRVAEILAGVDTSSSRFADAALLVAEQAHKQCHPIDNVPGDAEWRREMVPVYVRRTLDAALRGTGPVHHV